MTHDAEEPVTAAELLRLTLDAQGVSQVDLAEATGLSTKHINQILQGDIDLSPHCAWLIGHALGIPAEVWITLQAVHTVWRIAREQPRRGERVMPKLRRQRDEARREADRLRTELADTRQQLEHRLEDWESRHAVELTKAERDEARWTACYYRNAWRAQDELAELSLGLLPGWLTDDPQPTDGPTRQGHDGAQDSPAAPDPGNGTNPTQ
jgi:plasmid maintenance system antidote protein VapI